MKFKKVKVNEKENSLDFSFTMECKKHYSNYIPIVRTVLPNLLVSSILSVEPMKSQNFKSFYLDRLIN
jgi:hypothetical protein